MTITFNIIPLPLKAESSIVFENWKGTTLDGRWKREWDGGVREIMQGLKRFWPLS